MERKSPIARSDDGFSLPELLVGLLLFAILSLGVFSALRCAVTALRAAREDAKVSTARIIIRENFKSALLGAAQYTPVPLFKITEGSNFLSPAVDAGTVIVAARVVPELIYQRDRSAGSSSNAFCRHLTGLPLPEKGSTAALAVAVSSLSLKKLQVSRRRLRACGENDGASVSTSSLPDVFGLNGERAGKTEALIPVADIYSLSTDKDGNFRRRSLLTGENQPVLANVIGLSIRHAAETNAVTIDFKLGGTSIQITPIVLPVPNKASYDYIDLIW